MLRSAWVALALVALGLWASFVPQVSYTAYSSGAPGSDVLVAWPGWAVQQDVGPVGGTVGMFQIWVSAEPSGDMITIWASLVDAATLQVERQTSFDVKPGYFPASRSIMFPRYVVPSGQRLLLQLQVAEHEHNYVVYRLAKARPDLANLMLNGVPDAGSGPLALAQVYTGSGLRAAIVGEASERIRLALAFMFSALAIVVYPSALAVAQLSLSRARKSLVLKLGRVQSVLMPVPAQNRKTQATRIGRLLHVPWYPWLVATVPILNFLVNNSLQFAVSEVTIPLFVALALVTVLAGGAAACVRGLVSSSCGSFVFSGRIFCIRPHRRSAR